MTPLTIRLVDDGAYHVLRSKQMWRALWALYAGGGLLAARALTGTLGTALISVYALVAPALLITHVMAIARRKRIPLVRYALSWDEGGLRLERDGRPHYLPRRRGLQATLDEKLRVLAVFGFDQRLTLPLPQSALADARELCARIQRDNDAHAPDLPHELAARLARGERTWAEWLEHLRASAPEAATGAGYRGVPQETEELAEVFGSRLGAIEDRAAAAFLLQRADPHHRAFREASLAELPPLVIAMLHLAAPQDAELRAAADGIRGYLDESLVALLDERAEQRARIADDAEAEGEAELDEPDSARASS